MLTQQETYRVS